MKDFKQLKQTALKIKKKRKVRNMINRAFSKLRSNYDYIYYD